MNLVQAIRSRGREERQLVGTPLAFDDWASMFSLGNFGLGVRPTTTLGTTEERIGTAFTGLIEGAYRNNGIVFACMLVRMLLFSEARFQFRQVRTGRPGNLFGSRELRILEQPWPGGTTGDLLTRAIQSADLAGNAFVVRRRDRLVVLRPDWVTIVRGSYDREVPSTWDADTQLVGYAYQPGGPGSGRPIIALGPEEVAHFAPIPDPEASFRGMSWMAPIVREIMADSAGTTHKLKYFENGATPNMVVTLDASLTADKFREWVQVFQEGHEGYLNAYKTLFLGGGSSATPVGSNLQQVDFKSVQGAGETRIAAAAGVPPVIVGLSEGLASATYSNYGQARRRFADGTMRPLWRNFAGSMSRVVVVPAGSELWYDDRDIPFLQEDVKDAAEIQSVQSQSIKALVDAGFDPLSVVDAITSGDLNRLAHSGLYSVQLQPPQPGGPAADAGRALAHVLSERANGNGAKTRIAQEKSASHA